MMFTAAYRRRYGALGGFIPRVRYGTYDDSALDDLLSALPEAEVPIDPMPSLPPETPSTPTEAEPAPELVDGIWTRQPEETATAYASFCTYRDLGPTRSLDAAYAAAGGPQKGHKRATRKRASGHWRRWYRDHDWRNRAEAYDAHLDQVKRQAEIDKWKTRGEALVERQYTVALDMLKKAQQMLAFPLVEKTVKQIDEKGNEIDVTVEPARWNMNSAARLAKVAVEMARLAAGLPTKHEQSVHFEIDPSQLTDEQIEPILAGEHPAAVVSTTTQGDPVHPQG